MENKLNVLVGILNEIGLDYNVRFSVTTRAIISSNRDGELELCVFFENDTLKNKRILRFKSDRYSDGDVLQLCNMAAASLLKYLMFSKDFNGNGVDLGKNVPVEVFSAKTIFNRVDNGE